VHPRHRDKVKGGGAVVGSGDGGANGFRDGAALGGNTGTDGDRARPFFLACGGMVLKAALLLLLLFEGTLPHPVPRRSIGTPAPS